MAEKAGSLSATIFLNLAALFTADHVDKNLLFLGHYWCLFQMMVERVDTLNMECRQPV
jgi:hypothetical protein